MKKNKEKLAKEIVEYYFSNPHSNSSKEMVKKFGVYDSFITKVLRAEFTRRREFSKSIRKNIE